MALKISEQAVFDVINKSFSGMISAGMNLDLVKDILGEQIKSFEQSTKYKVNFVINEDESEGSLEMIDLSKDFLRIRNPNEDTKVLRTKVEGVGIEIKVFKKDDYKFSNLEIINALKSLTEKVEKIKLVLSEQDVSDINDIEIPDVESATLTSDEDLESALLTSDEDIESALLTSDEDVESALLTSDEDVESDLKNNGGNECISEPKDTSLITDKAVD